MAFYGSCRSNDDDNNAGCLMKWPLEYVRETKEYTCGRCGQLLTANHSHDVLETHFKSCKNSKESEFSIVFRKLMKINQRLDGLEANMHKKVDEMKAEVMKEIKTEVVNVETKVRKEIEGKEAKFKKEFLILKSEIKESEKISAEARDGILPALFRKVKTLEEGMKEKMAEVNGRFTGVTETILSVVHSMLEVKVKEMPSSADNLLSNELDRSKKETEALWVQLGKSEGENKTTNSRLEDEVAGLKTGMETLSVQLKTNDEDIRAIKKQLKDEQAKNELKENKTCFHIKPSPFHQLTIPMNSFNLVIHNNLFQPSFRWTIDNMDAITTQKTFELSSEMFQWKGWPVHARAELQLKEDGCIYIRLCLANFVPDESEPKGFTPIPQVFYLLKDKNARNPRHICKSSTYLFGSTLKKALPFDELLVRNSWLKRSTCKVYDSVEIEIYVEPSPMIQHAHSYDGTLEWNIENYRRRLQLEEENRILPLNESPCFYTSPGGYRVQVEICLKKGELTAFVSFLTGKFDAELPEYFLHSTTVTLLCRKFPERSISETFVENIANETNYNFKICRVVEMEHLIKNDTLFCKVVIKAQ